MALLLFVSWLILAGTRSKSQEPMQLAPTAPNRCCEEPEQITIGQSDDTLIDPTLASCCQKDLREQQRVEEAKKALLSLDRIDRRSRATQAVLGLAPPPAKEEPRSDFDDASSNEDGEYCYLLDKKWYNLTS